MHFEQKKTVLNKSFWGDREDVKATNKQLKCSGYAAAELCLPYYTFVFFLCSTWAADNG